MPTNLSRNCHGHLRSHFRMTCSCLMYSICVTQFFEMVLFSKRWCSSGCSRKSVEVQNPPFRIPVVLQSWQGVLTFGQLFQSTWQVSESKSVAWVDQPIWPVSDRYVVTPTAASDAVGEVDYSLSQYFFIHSSPMFRSCFPITAKAILGSLLRVMMRSMMVPMMASRM